MLNNNYVVKEFFDLNGHYLKLFIFNEDIHIVCYNTFLLNGIKYETKISSQEINNKVQIMNFTSVNLFELISKKIEEKKYLINSDQLNVSILLLETSKIFDQTKDIKIVIPKNNSHMATEYEKVLSREVFKLRQENRKLSNEINQIKNFLKINNGFQSNLSLHNSMVNKSINQFNNSSLLLQSSNHIQSSQFEKNINMNNNSIRQVKTNQNIQPKGDINNNNKIINQDLSLNSLSNLNYPDYPKVQLSPNPYSLILCFGANSYKGITRSHNEDRIKIILDCKCNLNYPLNNSKANPHISYFALYDGHGGNKCCNFLKDNLHNFLLESEYFPSNPLKAINQAFEKAELTFELSALDKENKKLLDKSGSCALSALFIDEWCYMAYLGDSRAIYSYDGGNQLFQVTRDHKPDDLKERMRIEKAGGKIYKDTRIKVNGIKIKVNEKDAPGVVFPCRVSPGNLSVRIFNY